MPSIGDSMIIIVAAMPTGCRAAGEPAKDWCAELGTNQGAARAAGRFSATYSGRFGTAPGKIESLVKEVDQKGIVVQGCARPANGDLWRLVTVWDNLPPPEQLPVAVRVDTKQEPFFWGELAVCYGGDCGARFQSVFRILPGAADDEGSGTVSVLDTSCGHFVATMTVHNGILYHTEFPHEPIVIDVDLTWPPEAFPSAGLADAAAEKSAAWPADGSLEGTSDASAPTDASDGRD